MLSACSFGPSASQKAEAGRISHAIDGLREAPNASKRERFGALASAPCETPDLCQLKQLCVAGYTAHLHALAETARAKALLAEPRSESEAANVLDRAQSELAEAATQLAGCADAQGAAQRRYRP